MKMKRVLAGLLAAVLVVTSAPVTASAANTDDCRTYLLEETQFDGTGNAETGRRMITAEDDLNFMKGMESGTVTATFKTTSVGLQALVALNSNSHANDYISLYIRDGNKLGMEIRENAANYSKVVTLSQSFTDGLEHTVTFKVKKGVGYSFYFDGKLVSDAADQAAVFIAARSWAAEHTASLSFGGADRISTADSGNYFYTGSLKNVKIYNRALSDKEVLADHPARTDLVYQYDNGDFTADTAYEPDSDETALTALKALDHGTIIARYRAESAASGEMSLFSFSDSTGTKYLSVCANPKDNKAGMKIVGATADNGDYTINPSAKGVNVNNTEWHTVGIVKRMSEDQNRYYVYFDGQQLGYYSNRTAFTNIVNTADSIRIGYIPSTGNQYRFTGAIDSVRVYSTSFSNAEMAAATGEEERIASAAVNLSDVLLPENLDTVTAVPAEGSNFTAGKITWDRSAIETANEVTATLTLTAKEGYQFSSTATATLAGTAANGTVSRDNKTMTLTAVLAVLDANLARTATASANGNSGNNVAAFVIDGDANTMWTSTGGVNVNQPKELTLTFSEPTEVQSLVINWERKNPKTYEIQMKADEDSEFEIVKSFTGIPNYCDQIINLETPQMAKEIKIVIKDFYNMAILPGGAESVWQSNPTVSITELEVYSQSYTTPAKDTFTPDLQTEELQNLLNEAKRKVALNDVYTEASINGVKNCVSGGFADIQGVIDTNAIQRIIDEKKTALTNALAALELQAKPEKRNLFVGETAKILNTDGVTDITWKSGDENILHVDTDTWTVKALKAGDADLIATVDGTEYPVTMRVYGNGEFTYPIGMTAAANTENANAGSEGPAWMAIDGKENTHWHSNYTPKDITPSPETPAILTITLADAMDIDGFKFQQRNGNGRVTKYRYELKNANGEIAASADSKTITVSGGQWEVVENQVADVKQIIIYVEAGEAGFAAIAEVTPYVKLAESAAISGETTVSVGSSTQLTAAYSPEGSAAKDPVWETSDAEVATVDQNGLVTGVAEGTATISIKNAAGTLGTVDISVIKAVMADYTAVDEAIAEANKLVKNLYKKDSWDALQAALKAVKRNLTADQQTSVDTMANAISEAIKKLELKKKPTVDEEPETYTVTVNNGIDATQSFTGKYNEILMVKTQKNLDGGRVFAGWEVDGKIVSTKTNYKFAISGDMTVIARFVNNEEEVPEQKPEADISNIILTPVTQDGVVDVKFIVQLTVPEGYIIRETGLLYSAQDTAEVLHNENAGPTDNTVKRTNVYSVNMNDQFSVTIGNMPVGRFLRGQAFAIVESPEGETAYVYSVEKRVVNEAPTVKGK